MAKKTSTVKLGIFIFLGITILVVAIFMLGGKEQLFSSTFNVKAYFKTVQGLKSGATVRLSGIDVGTVKDVQIVNDTTGRVQVTMSIKEDVGRFIRTDTRATIETEGLVGNKVVVLEIGSSSAERVRDGGTIRTKEPMSISAVIEETQGVMEYTKRMTKDLSEIVARVNRGEGSIGKLLVDDELYTDATNLTKQADKSLQSITGEFDKVTELFDNLGQGVKSVVTNVDSTIADLDSILTGVKEGRGILGEMLVNGSPFDSTLRATMKNVEKTTADARLAASRLAENMEALKHNWLFKSYFENRGYWDKAEYEDNINDKLKELDEKIKLIDNRIKELKSLEAQSSSK
jgi:phospholipid/cholesterol/gamma-HCH transport system substrate-binding protein